VATIGGGVPIVATLSPLLSSLKNQLKKILTSSADALPVEEEQRCSLVQSIPLAGGPLRAVAADQFGKEVSSPSNNLRHGQHPFV